MRSTALLLSSVLLGAGCAHSTGPKPAPTEAPPVPVTGQVSRIAPSHCAGGLAPPATEPNPPRPWQGVLLVRPGLENSTTAPVLELRTDAEGRFEGALPPGTWCVVTEDRRERAKIPGTNEALPPEVLECAEAEWRTCLAIWEVVDSPLQANIDIHEKCPWERPCTQGRLPPPPPSPPARHTVTGRLLESKPFCGGAGGHFTMDPAAPRGSSAELLVLPGTRNSGDAPFTRVTPGADGRFELQLPPGEWCFVEADRHSEEPPRLNPPAKVDEACWKDRWSRCLDTVNVTSGPVNAGEFLIVRHCPWADPCISGLPSPPHRVIPPVEQQPRRPGPNPPPPPPAPTRTRG
ncbi:MAG: hypothetical protein WBV82_08065 [Myxococcaceae bacterium]